MTHIEQRAGTAAQWTSTNPVLNLNEFGWETNTNKGKIGDGVTAWNALPYFIISAPSLPVTSVAGRTGAVVLSVADVAGAAPLASPALTGAPTAPTAVGTDNTTKIATTAHVKAALAASPALGGTPTAPTQAVSANGTSIATTAFVKSQGYAPTVSPALTGAPTAPTQAATENSTRIATTAYVRSTMGNNALNPAATAKAASMNTNNTTFTVMALTRNATTDPSNIYVAASGNYTVPVAGTYLLTAAAQFASAAGTGSHRLVTCWIDGVEDARASAFVTSGGAMGATLSYLTYLSANQVVNFRIYQDSGAVMAIAMPRTGVAFIR